MKDISKFFEISIIDDKYKNIDFYSPISIAAEHNINTISSRLFFTKHLNYHINNLIEKPEDQPGICSIIDEAGIQPTETRSYSILCAAEFGASEVEIGISEYAMSCEDLWEMEKDMDACINTAQKANLDICFTIPEYTISNKDFLSNVGRVISKYEYIKISNNCGAYNDSDDIWDDILSLQRLKKYFGENNITKMYVNDINPDLALKMFKAGINKISVDWEKLAQIMYGVHDEVDKDKNND